MSNLYPDRSEGSCRLFELRGLFSLARGPKQALRQSEPSKDHERLQTNVQKPGASRLERLPNELLEIIFFNCLNPNLFFVSRRLKEALSSSLVKERFLMNKEREWIVYDPCNLSLDLLRVEADIKSNSQSCIRAGDEIDTIWRYWRIVASVAQINEIKKIDGIEPHSIHTIHWETVDDGKPKGVRERIRSAQRRLAKSPGQIYCFCRDRIGSSS